MGIVGISGFGGNSLKALIWIRHKHLGGLLCIIERFHSITWRITERVSEEKNKRAGPTMSSSPETRAHTYCMCRSYSSDHGIPELLWSGKVLRNRVWESKRDQRGRTYIWITEKNCTITRTLEMTAREWRKKLSEFWLLSRPLSS